MNASLERLTRRELEVAVLVRDGLTDREVAEKLFISRRTAEWHVEQILSKLGLRSRSQIAARVAQAELAPAVGPRVDQKSPSPQWPPQPMLLFGRQRELSEIRELILRPEVRLVTLTGPPGAGKTTIGARVAIDTANEFRDGAAFVDLSPIVDPALVVPAIAQVLGAPANVRELGSALMNKRILIMLDNFEQVLAAGQQVAKVLVACPGLKVLVTSRECLHLFRWEHEHPVGPLQLPDPDRLPSVKEMSAVASIALFLDRAQARNPRFELTNQVAHTVATICVRLDGLPLAIELAAAAVKSLAPLTILNQLQEGKEIPSHGGADFPKRHRSLHQAIQASHDRLSNDERLLLRRLGVFVGGFDLESIDAVCTGEGITPDYVIKLLSRLVDKSLVQPGAGGDRYRLLETIREFALRRLESMGEAELTTGRHTRYFLQLGEIAWKKRRGVEEYAWYERIAPHIDNFRATLARALASWDLDTGLRLSAALSRFWFVHGFWDEGRRFLEKFVTGAEDTGQSPGFAAALGELGWVNRRQGEYATGAAQLERYLQMARRLNDHAGVAFALVELGNACLEARDFMRARPLLSEAIDEGRVSEYKPGLVDALMSMGLVAHAEHDDRTATEFIEESLSIARGAGDIDGTRIALLRKGQIAFTQGAYRIASDSWTESLQMFWSQGWPSPALLVSFARLAMVRDEPGTALRLGGAAEAVRELAHHGALPRWMRRGVPWGPTATSTDLPFSDLDFGRQLDMIAGGDAKGHADWKVGHAMPAQEAVELALAVSLASTKGEEFKTSDDTYG